MEMIGWLEIVASLLLIGLGISAFIYFQNLTFTNLIIAIVVSLLGLIIVIIWATKIWKTKGTIWFVFQISTTPDIDNLIDAKKETKKGSH
jgi:hypothetical protein